ncbi:MAG: hypothetical protein QM791_08010 [Ferruginibacter sp.]
MKQFIFSSLFIIITAAATAQSKFPKNQISINGFRNPSIGLEYQRNQFSVHAGYYTTAFKKGEYTNFVKAGVTYWFLPSGDKTIPSSFYAGASFMHGLTRDYKNVNAYAVEAGYRWMVWKGLNLRLGAIAVMANGKSLKVNPTPGISYSFSF